MLRFPRLNKIIQAAVVAAMPLAAGACCSGYENPSDRRVVPIDHIDVESRDQVDACFADDLACESLCDTMVRKLGVDRPDELLFTECRMIDDGPGGQTRLHMTYEWPDRCIAGRRPAALVPCPEPDTRSAVGAFLARMAYLEAASVYEFRTVARELTEFGAPVELVRRALRAADDEVLHAVITRALARRWGAAPAVPRIEHTPRDLERFCADNAAEGCVKETYGAAVATWQARAARDPAIRAAMAPIARDETEHAQLAADVDAWARPRLSREAARRVRDVRRRTADEVVAGAAAPVASELVTDAGVPAPAVAAAIASHMRAELWAA